MKNNVVVISGASSGVGREIAILLATSGYRVYNLSRSPSNLYGVVDMKCDITSDDDVKVCFNEIKRREKEIGVLINNSGMGISGPTVETPLEYAKKQFEVNFFGHHLVTSYFINIIKKGEGKILFTSSLAAPFSIPFQSFYSASKSSIESYAKALRNEIRDFGIDVCYIRLGDTKTSFTKNRIKLGLDNGSYNAIDSIRKMEIGEENGMDPRVIAKFYFKLIKRKHLKVEYTIGRKNKFLVRLNKFLPTNYVNKIVRKLYVLDSEKEND